MTTFTESRSAMAKIAIDKCILKEYTSNSNNERTVFMDNSTEFQIQLFNPKSNTIGAEISINGKKLNGIIVLRPGERIWLERYLDTHSKFKFSTYEVEDTEEVSNAIANNGVITVSFYDEIEPVKYTPTTITCPNRNEWYDRWYDSSFGNSILFNSELDTVVNDCTKSALHKETRCKSIKSLNTNEAGCMRSINANVSDSTLSLNADANYSTSLTSSTIETGRIDKGSYSSQLFEQVQKEFATWAFSTETIHILPTSRKQYTPNDMQKIYCTNCGRKLNTKYKFCPYCGTKCEQ